MPFLSRTGFAFGDDFLYKSHMEILCQTEISQKPCRVSQKPCRVSRKPRRVSRKPCRVSRKPCRVSRKPRRVSQKPCRVSKNLRVLIHGFKFLIVFIL